jgi:dienelactone hydrolase
MNDDSDGMRAWLVVAAVFGLFVAGCGGHRHVAISATPTIATYDVPVDLHVTGLPANRTVTLELRGRNAAGPLWTGARTARTDAHGTLALPDLYPPTWMHHPGRAKLASPTSLTVAVAGARVTVHRDALPQADLRPSPEPLAETGFFGSWHAPPGSRHHTAILLFGGSEGGMFGEQTADVLAAHGYPVLDLAYFAEPGLPQDLANIRLEYFERALRWLARQPQVDPRRIVTFGVSRGGELSLLLASTFPKLVHGAVGYVPASQVHGSLGGNGTAPAWTYRGKPIWGGTPIPVERIAGPVFVVGGGSDALWSSSSYVQQIAQRLHAHGRHDVTALVYPGAGHLVGEAVPRLVIPPAQGYGQVTTRYGPLFLGGAPRADELAREDSWPKLLAYLRRIGASG